MVLGVARQYPQFLPTPSCTHAMSCTVASVEKESNALHAHFDLEIKQSVLLTSRKADRFNSSHVHNCSRKCTCAALSLGCTALLLPHTC